MKMQKRILGILCSIFLLCTLVPQVHGADSALFYETEKNFDFETDASCFSHGTIVADPLSQENHCLNFPTGISYPYIGAAENSKTKSGFVSFDLYLDSLGATQITFRQKYFNQDGSGNWKGLLFIEKDGLLRTSAGSLCTLTPKKWYSVKMYYDLVNSVLCIDYAEKGQTMQRLCTAYSFDAVKAGPFQISVDASSDVHNLYVDNVCYTYTKDFHTAVSAVTDISVLKSALEVYAALGSFVAPSEYFSLSAERRETVLGYMLGKDYSDVREFEALLKKCCADADAPILFDCPDKVILPPQGRISSVPCHAYVGELVADVEITSVSDFAYLKNGYLVLRGNASLPQDSSITLTASAFGKTATKTVRVVDSISDNFDSLASGAAPVAANSAYSWDAQSKCNAQKRTDAAGMYLCTSDGNYNARMNLADAVDKSYGSSVTLEFSSGAYYGANIAGGILGGILNYTPTSSSYVENGVLSGVITDLKNLQTTQYNVYTLYNKNGIGSIGNKTEFVRSDAELDKYFRYRFEFNLVNGTYDLYIEDTLVLDDYHFNTAADSTNYAIRTILWQSSFDSVALYSGRGEPEDAITVADTIIAPPKGVTAKLAYTAAKGVSLTGCQSDYSVSYDEAYLYITGNGQAANASLVLTADGIQIPLKKTISVKACVSERFDSYAAQTKITDFVTTDSYTWAAARASTVRYPSSTEDFYLNAGDGKYGAFLSLREAIDSSYGDYITFEFRCGFGEKAGSAGNTMGSVYSNDCFREAKLTADGDYVSDFYMKESAIQLAMSSDHVAQSNDAYNMYLNYDENGVGAYNAHTVLMNKNIAVSQYDTYRYVINMKKNTYSLYLNGFMVAKDCKFNLAATEKKIKSIAFLNPVDDIAIYSGCDTSFTEIQEPYLFSFENKVGEYPVYGYYNAGIFQSKVTVSNNTDTDAPVCVVGALYGENDALLQMNFSDTLIESRKSAVLSVSLSVADSADTKIKLFVLDALNGLKPYTAPHQLKGKVQTEDYSLYLIGDSVCQEYAHPQYYPMQGWGYYMQEYFDSHVQVKNYARSGWATTHYLGQWETGASYSSYLWENILPQIKEGDYCIVALGINDGNTTNGYGSTQLQYINNLKQFAKDTRAKGAEIIFVTPTIATGPEGSTLFGNTWWQRGAFMKQAAAEAGVVCIDLGAYTTELYNAMAKQYNTEAGYAENDSYGYNKTAYFFNMFRTNFLQLEAEGGFGYTTATIESCGISQVRANGIGYDGTHLNCRGSEKMAQIITSLIQQTNLPIGENIIRQQ